MLVIQDVGNPAKLAVVAQFVKMGVTINALIIVEIIAQGATVLV